MASVFETARSRKFTVSQASGSKFTLEYIVIQATDENAAWAAVVATTPIAYQGLPREAYTFDPQGGSVWIVSTEYNPKKRNDAKNSDAGKKSDQKPNDHNTDNDQRPVSRAVAGSTAGGTQHITTSLAFVDGRRVKTDGTVVNAAKFQTIGWSRHGIAGTDVVAPNGEFAIGIQFDTLTFGYLYTLYYLTATVNKNDWAGFAAGEVLFLGADYHWVDGDTASTGHTANPGHWLINFRFKLNPNRATVDLGQGIQFQNVKGWDLIDVIYAESEVIAQDAGDAGYDATDTVLMQFPEFAYVQQVYRYEDFAQLEIDEEIFATE